MNETKTKKCIKCKAVLVGNKKRMLCSNCKSEITQGTIAFSATCAVAVPVVRKVIKDVVNKRR